MHLLKTKQFNKQTISLVVAGTLSLLAATAANAASPSQTAPATEQSSPANYSSEAINFSFALKGNDQLNFADQAATSHSDEYYFTVNGQQLSKGVNVHTSTKGALIKISRQGDRGQPLKNEALELRAAAQPKVNLATNIIGENDLKATGIFNHASAIKIAANVQPGTFKLRTNQNIDSDNLYVIHVKEKNSANQLALSAKKQYFTQGEAFSFDAAMMAKDQTLAFNTVSAFIRSPSGKQSNIKVNRLTSGVAQISAQQFAIDADAIEAPVNGLYELHVNAVANNNGQQIHRSGKIAFALAPDTAELNKSGKLLNLVNAKNPQTNVALTVKEAGRFEVRATLFGHNAYGQLQPVMETHSAQNLTVGEQNITVKFDQKILANSGLVAPFTVRHVKLYDQTRLSRL
ncbi:MAG: hypothetical protein ACI8WB_003645 [Phenylobacterium sp.]|jgi:hypothetical protein